MSFFSRIFKKKPQEKESRVARLHVFGGSQNIASDKDYEKHCKETYLKNTIAFRCIQDIAQACSQPNWNLYQRDNKGNNVLVENHPINDLLNRPNPQESWAKLIYKTAAYLAMTGNSFFEGTYLMTRASKYPSEMFVLRPDRFEIIPNDKGQIGKYKYRTNSGVEYFEVDPITLHCNLLHINFFHPLNDFWGAAPVEPAARDIDSSNEATDWNLNLIRNQGRPGLVFTVIGDISDDEFNRLEKAINEKFSGPMSAGKNILITGDSGTKAEPYTMKLSDLEFIEGGRELARKIALAFGISPILLGIPGDSTYNNQKEARLAFYEGTVTFYLNMIMSELNNWLFDPRKDGLFLKYDLNSLPAMEPRQEILWRRAQESNFLTINEKRKLTGYDSNPDGDVILVPAGVIPLDMVQADLNLDLEKQARRVSKDDEEFNMVMGLQEQINVNKHKEN